LDFSIRKKAICLNSTVKTYDRSTPLPGELTQKLSIDTTLVNIIKSTVIDKALL
jgi:hypothetical protein